MTFRPVPLSCIAALLGAATLSAASADQMLEMKGYPPVGAQPVISVTKEGSAPRTQLRYVIAADQKARIDLTTSGSLTLLVRIGDIQNKQGVIMPTLKVTAELSATSVASNGDLAYDIAFRGTSLEPTSGFDPATIRGLQPLADLASSIKGSATVSSSGVVRSMRVDVPRPETQRVLGGLISAVEHLLVPFPDAAVGVGARWQVREAVEFRGLVNFRPTVFRQTEYEVLSIDGPTVALQVRTILTGPPQPLVSLTPPIGNQGIVFGAENRLEKMSGSGAGKMVVRLDSLVPASEKQSTTSIVFSSTINEQWSSNTLDAKTKVTIAAAR